MGWRFGMTSLGQYWADWIIEECVRQGITNVGVAPGARSAALVIAAAKHPSLTTCVHFDERALGFWALGYAKASGRPAIVITTSGTAVANLLPAVVEASQSSTPLIILSADRPHELHDIGANQTITQEGIFGNYVRWSTTLPSPTSEISPLYLLSTMDYAVFKATQIHPGPVQINCMFREPLLAGQNLLDGYEKCLEKWQVSSSPFTTYPRFKAGLDPAQIERCNELLSNSKSGCFIVGSMSKVDAQAVLQAAQRFHWPILAEGGSGLSVVDHPLVLDLTKL